MKKIFNIFAIVAIAFAMASCCNNCGKCEACETEAADSVSSVLVVVDVQRDFFCPEGSLYVGGSEALPAKIAAIADSYDAVIFTLDWHPANHCSFAAQGGIWPSHCVAYTQGAGLADEFAPILAKGESKYQIYLKGTNPEAEEYGAFENLGDCKIRTWLETAEKVDVCGIAGDYCVKESTANILKVIPAEKVSFLSDCIRSIDDGSTLASFASETSVNLK